MLNTPGGSTSFMICATRSTAKGASSADFTTTVLPATIAGAILSAISRSGTFHGMIAPTTPIGSRWVMVIESVLNGTLSPLSSDPKPPKNTNTSASTPASTRLSVRSALPVSSATSLAISSTWAVSCRPHSWISRPRSRGCSLPQLFCALAAAWTARSTSAATPSAAWPIVSPVAGLTTAKLLPDSAGTSLPSISSLFDSASASAKGFRFCSRDMDETPGRKSISLRHSREGGNPEPRARSLGPAWIPACAGMTAGLALEKIAQLAGEIRQHHREVLGAAAGGREQLVDRRRLGAERRHRARGLGRLLGQLQVLQHHVGGEARRVAAVRRRGRHRAGRRAIGRQRPALARGFRADIIELLRIEAELLGERERLRDGGHGDAEDHVVADLGRLARARPTTMDDGLAHLRQIGAGLFHRGIRPADHEGERAGSGPAGAARYRRVDHGEATVARRRPDRTGGIDVDGRAVDQQRTGLGRGEDALRVEVGAAHMRAGRQHGDDHLGIGDRLGGRGRGDAAGGGEGLDRGLSHVEAGDLMPGLDQVLRHRAAHVAEADKCNLAHDSGLLQQAARDDDAHDFVGPFEDLVDAQVPQIPLDRIFLDVAVAAMEQIG